jgi:adhesin/invasin
VEHPVHRRGGNPERPRAGHRSNGFSAPQSSSSSSEGFVSVTTDEPTGTPALSVSGQNITIDVDTLTTGNTITIVYGDDSGSVNGRASAVTTPGSYPFITASDPSGTSVSPIAASPSLTVIADTPDHIEIAPSDTTVVAGTFPPYRLIVRDQYGNRAPVASTRTLNLVASSGQFFAPANHSTPITTINIASGKTSVRVDYKGTLASPSGSPTRWLCSRPRARRRSAAPTIVNVAAAALSTSQSTISASSPWWRMAAHPARSRSRRRTSSVIRVAGDDVAISVTGSAIKSDPGSSTDANGEALGIVTDVVAEGVVVSATINGQAITDTAPSRSWRAPVDASTSIVNATTPVVANGSSTSTVTVTAKDANGNPVSGQSVTLSVLPSTNATLTQPGA